jgi:CubicO group peptidase (beta-lactamase class C family)
MKHYLRIEMRIGILAATLAGLSFGTSLAQSPASQATPRPSHSAASAPRLTREEPIPSVELEALVDGVIGAAMTRDHLGGVTASVVQDGQVVFKKGYGFSAPGRTVDPDLTLFRIGSISKTFTWIAAMQEVESGRMRLDAPINDYLPKDLAVPAVTGWRQVNLRDFMSHTPGFEERILDHLFVETPAQMLPLNAKLKVITEKRVFEPGKTLAYSNLGLMLTGAAVSHLNGAAFQDVIEQKITRPLGLDRTTFREPYPPRADLTAPMSPALAADASTAYHWTGTELISEPYEWISQAGPAGAASSTASDMARYMLTILGDGELQGTRIYSTATALSFRTPIPVPTPNGGEVSNGFLQTQLPGGFLGYGHDGDTLWFHSNLVTVPALRLGIFLSTNTDTGERLVRELPQQIVDHFYAVPSSFLKRVSPVLANQSAVYEGTYVSNRRAFSGLEKFVGLMTRQASVDVTQDGYLVTQNGGNTQAWTPSGSLGHFLAIDGSQTSDFAFRDGKAVTWYEPDGTVSFDRVGPVYQRNVLLIVVLVATIAAAAVLNGAAIGLRRAAPSTRMQRRMNRVQILAAGTWLIALGFCAIFIGSAEDQGHLVFNWPGMTLLTASTAALLSSALSFGILVALPFIWKDDEGWNSWRKVRFTIATVIFCALGLQLSFWGFLEPWAS